MRWLLLAMFLCSLAPLPAMAQQNVLRCVDQSAGNFASIIRSDMTIVREQDGALLGPVMPVANGSAKFQLPSGNMQFMYLVAWNNSLVVYNLANGTSQTIGQCFDLAVSAPVLPLAEN